MNKKAADLPEQLSFVVDVVADITLEKYSSALEKFVDGARRLVTSPAPVTDDDFLHVISAMENAVMYKLASNGLIPDKGIDPSSAHEEEWCRFCGKSAQDVEQLIAGPGVFICNDCVGTCNQVLKESKSED